MRTHDEEIYTEPNYEDPKAISERIVERMTTGSVSLTGATVADWGRPAMSWLIYYENELMLRR